MGSTLRGFPTLEPAIVVKLNATTANPLGVIHTGSTMVHFVSSFQPPSVFCPLTVKQETPTGTLESIEGFSPAFKAKVNFGADWLRFDPDRAHGRIDVKGIARTEEGHSISFSYVGIIDMDEDVWKIFNMQPDMKTVPFGNAAGAWSFIVADPKLKDLEHSMWASSGRISVHEGGQLVVESRIAKVKLERVMD